MFQKLRGLRFERTVKDDRLMISQEIGVNERRGILRVGMVNRHCFREQRSDIKM